MTPTTGQHVRVLFRNGLSMDGIVEEWCGNYAQLKSTTDESTIIITNPTEDIMVIKILAEEVPEETSEESEEKEPEVISIPLAPSRSSAEVFRDPPSFSEPHSAYDLARNKSLAELKIMANEQERQIIANKLKNHYPSQTKRPQYGYLGFFKRPTK